MNDINVPENDLIYLGGYIREVVKRLKNKELSDSIAFLSDRNLGLLAITIQYTAAIVHKNAVEQPTLF